MRGFTSDVNTLSCGRRSCLPAARQCLVRFSGCCLMLTPLASQPSKTEIMKHRRRALRAEVPVAAAPLAVGL